VGRTGGDGVGGKKDKHSGEEGEGERGGVVYRERIGDD